MHPTLICFMVENIFCGYEKLIGCSFTEGSEVVGVGRLLVQSSSTKNAENLT